MRILPLIIAGSALLYSCDKKETTNVANSEIAAPNTQVITTDSSNTNGELNSENIASNAGDRPALNPEHGLPYHRCEIPVGAPMDSDPAVNAAVPMVQPQNPAGSGFNTNPIAPSAAPIPQPSSVQPVSAKPARNPAHGEPHHRCDLEVGAPLI